MQPMLSALTQRLARFIASSSKLIASFPLDIIKDGSTLTFSNVISAQD